MGQSPDSSSYNEDKDGLPLIQGNADIINGLSSPKRYTRAPTKICDAGDILLTVRAPVGAVAIASEQSCIGRGVCSIKANKYIYYFLQSKEKSWAKKAQGSTFTCISSSDIKKLICNYPSESAREKTANFLTTIDSRIEVQNKIIERYESLIKQLNDDLFASETNCKIGDFIQECSKRNKDGAIINVLSVSNKNGFVKQSEQFEDKELASEDKTNYKIVQKGDFAFNPARINVGSIALLKKQETGIVSPMYICFKAKKIPNEVLESYFSSSSFKKEMNKRLEGSVRMCLTIDGMKNIRFHKPDEKEVNLLNHLTKLRDFVSINKKILDLYYSQKKYLLSNLFI